MLALLPLLSCAVATPLLANFENGQAPLSQAVSGFSLDLNEMRLVQMEGQAPVWMSELDKV